MKVNHTLAFQFSLVKVQLIMKLSCRRNIFFCTMSWKSKMAGLYWEIQTA